MPHLIQFALSSAPQSSRSHTRRWWGRRAPRLDLNALPDHLKRDLGFIGGRDLPLRDILRD